LNHVPVCGLQAKGAQQENSDNHRENKFCHFSNPSVCNSFKLQSVTGLPLPAVPADHTKHDYTMQSPAKCQHVLPKTQEANPSPRRVTPL